MPHLTDIRFMVNGIFIATIVLLFVTLSMSYRAWRGYQEVRQDARDDYAFKTREGMMADGVSEAAYTRAYERFHAPRSTAYIAAVLGAVLLLTYPALLLFQLLMNAVWVIAGRPESFQPGFLFAQSLVFFAMLMFWISMAAFAARRFHRSNPITFERELAKQVAGI